MRYKVRWIIGGVAFLLPVLLLLLAVPLSMIDGLDFAATIFPPLSILFTVIAGIVPAALVLTIRAHRWPRRLLSVLAVWVLLIGQIALILVWTISFGGFSTRQPTIAPTAKWMSPLNGKWIIQTPAKPHSLRTASDVKRDEGVDSLRFELRKGETYTDAAGQITYRSEVDLRDFPPMGSTRWYAFSVYLPEDFPLEDNRLILAQWHGVDKWWLGEAGRIPPLAFRYVDGKLTITMRHSEQRIISNPEAVSAQQLFKTRSFERGRWNDFVVEAKWSYKPDGLVDVWWNGTQVVSYSGPVGYNDDTAPYFRFGLYRDATDATYVAYFSGVKTGASAAEIGFTPPAAPATHPSTQAVTSRSDAMSF